MPTWLIIILLAILAVGLFVLAMSLTLIFKGHHIDSEIFHQRKHAQTGYQMRRSGDREQMTDSKIAHRSRMLGNCAACTPKRQPQYTAPQKIIGDKFSANRKHGQSEFRLPRVSIFSVSTPTMPRGGQSAAEHSPTIISASDLQPGILRARQKNQELTRSVLL